MVLQLIVCAIVESSRIPMLGPVSALSFLIEADYSVRTTIERMAIESTASPSMPEITSATMDIEIVRLLNWPKKICSGLMRLSSASLFELTAASRWAASCADKPLAPDLSCASTPRQTGVPGVTR